MFKSITSTIYGIWFIGIVIFVTFTVYREKTRTNLSILHQHMINAWYLKSLHNTIDNDFALILYQILENKQQL